MSEVNIAKQSKVAALLDPSVPIDAMNMAFSDNTRKLLKQLEPKYRKSVLEMCAANWRVVLIMHFGMHIGELIPIKPGREPGTGMDFKGVSLDEMETMRFKKRLDVYIKQHSQLKLLEQENEQRMKDIDKDAKNTITLNAGIKDLREFFADAVYRMTVLVYAGYSSDMKKLLKTGWNKLENAEKYANQWLMEMLIGIFCLEISNSPKEKNTCDHQMIKVPDIIRRG